LEEQIPMEPRKPLLLAVFATTLLFVSGCGGATRTIHEDFPSASHWFEGTPGSIGVLPGDYRPLLSFSSREARTDAAGSESANVVKNTVGAGCGADPVSGCNDEVVAAATVIVNPVVKSETTERWSEYGTPSLKKARQDLEHSLADGRPQLLVSYAVVSRIRIRTAYDAQLKSFRGHPEEFVPEGSFNGLVEIGLTKFGLVFDGQLDETVEDPRVAVEIGVSAILYSMRDRGFVRLASGGWEYLGTTHRLSKLTEENGRLLNEELERAARVLAKRIVD
jgi:hypothetical protein